MKYTVLFFILFVVFFEESPAQGLRYRLAANSSLFLTEINNKELNNTFQNILYPGSEKFKSEPKVGVEVEFLMPLKDIFEVGLELKYNELAGKTETAPLYNFFLSRRNPLRDSYRYPSESLIYSTKIFSFLATSRYYLLPADEETSLFLKAFGGVSFVGTDFTFANPLYRVEYEVGVLYARGSQNSDYPKKAAFNGGLGLGVIFEISNKISLYTDANTSFIFSDIVNGVPNYEYIQHREEPLKKISGGAIITQLSIGIIYSDFRVNKLIRNNRRKMQKIFR